MRKQHRKQENPRSLAEALKTKLTPKEREALQTSYDLLGNLIIIEIPSELKKKEKFIGEALLLVHPNVRTVCKKTGIHTGKFRTQKLKIIAGKKSKEAEYIENGVRIRLHAEKVYFSPRLSSERLRVARLVRPGERVLVMFSGCGPYTLVIGKAMRSAQVVGVEMNPIAHEYAQENVRLNRLKNVENHCGDVRTIVPKIDGKFDRIIMALPKDAGDFLDVALPVVRPGGMIHLYSFAHEEELAAEASHILEICEGIGYRCELRHVQKCGAYKPRVFRICIDFIVHGNIASSLYKQTSYSKVP